MNRSMQRRGLASPRMLPAGGARRAGACLALLLGLALATVVTSPTVSAEQVLPETDAEKAFVVQGLHDGSGVPVATGASEPGAEVGGPAPASGTAGGGMPAEPASSAAAGENAAPNPTAAPAPAVAPAPQAGGTPTAPRARSLLPLVQPLWSELSDSQRKILAPLETQWNTLTKEEKRPWLSLAARLPKMSSEDRARAEKRIREWAALTPEQRRLARDNYRLAKKLPKDQRVASWEQYQQMTPEQQAVLRQAGWTSNTAARHAGAPTGLAKEASQPLWQRLFKWIWKPEPEPKLAADGKPAGGASR